MVSKTIPFKNGMVEIPTDLRERYGIDDNSRIVIEAGVEGILIRPAGLPEPEVDTPERIAEFLLNNSVSQEDYRCAVEEVRRMGLDPGVILHDQPQP